MDIELRKVYGRRAMDSDGFTYRYGKAKGGFTKRQRHTNGINRNRRADKRGAKAAAMRREMQEAT